MKEAARSIERTTESFVNNRQEADQKNKNPQKTRERERKISKIVPLRKSISITTRINSGITKE